MSAKDGGVVGKFVIILPVVWWDPPSKWGSAAPHNSLSPGRDICGPQARLGQTASKTRKNARKFAPICCFQGQKKQWLLV